MCGIAGWWGWGSRSIDISIRHISSFTCQGGPLVTLLIRKVVNQVYPISIVLYGITLAPLAEELLAADLELIAPFLSDDAVFDGLV